MPEVFLQISRITKKVQQHLHNMSVLQKEFDHQKSVMREMREKQLRLEEQVHLLQEQNQVLKAATGDLTDGDKKDLETLINKYMRDIDKCIAMLSE
jgi:hypothetical protein